MEVIWLRIGPRTGCTASSARGPTTSAPGINNGEWYASPYDKTHDLSVVAMRPLSRSWNMGATFTFASGLPATFPESRYVPCVHRLCPDLPPAKRACADQQVVQHVIGADDAESSLGENIHDCAKQRVIALLGGGVLADHDTGDGAAVAVAEADARAGVHPVVRHADALGPERIDQIRRTGAAVGRLLDAIEARRSATTARTEQRRGK